MLHAGARRSRKFASHLRTPDLPFEVLLKEINEPLFQGISG